jgi:rhodanese-related sulfurtransferase
MDLALEFATNHMLLVMSFVAILFLLLFGEYKRITRCYGELTPSEAVMVMNRDEPVVVDVREANEVSQGKIKGAKHIPLGNLKQRVNELDPHKDQKVIIYCRSGNRSGQASEILCKQGFSKVFNLKGGVMAWQSDNLPLAKK